MPCFAIDYLLIKISSKISTQNELQLCTFLYPWKEVEHDIKVSKKVPPLLADLGEGGLSGKGRHTQLQLQWNNVHILLRPPRPLIHLDVLPHRCCSPPSTCSASRSSPPPSPPSSLPSPSATFASCLSPLSPLARPPCWEERKNVLRYLVVLTAPFSTDTKKQRPNKSICSTILFLVGSNKRQS